MPFTPARNMPDSIGTESFSGLYSITTLAFIAGAVLTILPIFVRPAGSTAAGDSLARWIMVPIGILFLLVGGFCAFRTRRAEKRRILSNRSLALGCNEPVPYSFRALFVSCLFEDASCENPGKIRLACGEYEMDPDRKVWLLSKGPASTDTIKGLTLTELAVSTDKETIDAAYRAFEQEVAAENRCRILAFKAARVIECPLWQATPASY